MPATTYARASRWEFDPTATTRRCYACKDTLPLDAFYRCKTDVLGRTRICQPCSKARQRRLIRTDPHYKALSLFHSMQARCRKLPRYSHVSIEMTRDEWTAWAAPRIEQFRQEHPGEVVSVDRIDPTKNYSFDNIRLIPKWENESMAGVHALCQKYGKTVDDFYRWVQS